MYLVVFIIGFFANTKGFVLTEDAIRHKPRCLIDCQLSAKTSLHKSLWYHLNTTHKLTTWEVLTLFVLSQGASRHKWMWRTCHSAQNHCRNFALGTNPESSPPHSAQNLACQDLRWRPRRGLLLPQRRKNRPREARMQGRFLLTHFEWNTW